MEALSLQNPFDGTSNVDLKVDMSLVLYTTPSNGGLTDGAQIGIVDHASREWNQYMNRTWSIYPAYNITEHTGGTISG